eukprot:TRINITY_DN10792_c0_g1_i5.p2 TRINITY_DN10792_c0_g1~~TRINITY_DN10792_c0_g1_i5.p2  ORF type:complete len:121 (+),score=21.17 TRINITY_DN10792_c0_g1_i5:157-519(+)
MLSTKTSSKISMGGPILPSNSSPSGSWISALDLCAFLLFENIEQRKQPTVPTPVAIPAPIAHFSQLAMTISHVLCVDTVSYTHLTLPTILLVQISVVAVSLKKKKKNNNQQKTNNNNLLQ